MRIGIDGNEANEVRGDIGERVGVNQYAFELLWSLYRLNKLLKNKKIFTIFLKRPPSDDLPKESAFWKYAILRGESIWVAKNLTPRLLFTRELDVFFAPNHYLPPFSSIPRVCTIHDLGYLKFTAKFKKYDFWQLKYWSAISIIVSKYIICPSRSTRKDIVRHYPFASKKVKVIYHGLDKNRFNTKINKDLVRRIKKKYNICKEYILFLGTLKPNKNVEGLLQAFAKITTQFPNYCLVIAGKKGWYFERIFEKARRLGLSEVIFTDYVSEKDKPPIIFGAKVLVLPSFWEGFGMDVLNAMACGTPVVLSEEGSLPEVGGDAAIYVDAYNIESIASGIKMILTMDQKKYQRIVERGLKQAKKFSWDKSARETLNVLEKAVGMR